MAQNFSKSARTPAAILLLALPYAGAMGAMNVQVVRNDQPIAGATVCVGTTQLLNQFGQGTTNASGDAVFNNVPSGAVIVTAHSANQGAQIQLSPPPVVSPVAPAVRISLQSGASARCPATPIPTSRGIGVNTAVLSKVPPPKPLARPATITPQRAQHCFGALGAECGQIPIANVPITALCANGRCKVNAGSWEHDECCWNHAHGMACQVGPLDGVVNEHDGNCVGAWNKALDRLGRGLIWERPINFQTTNSTGVVVFNEYCAPRGTRIDAADERFCCSRRASPTVNVPNVRTCN